MGPENISSKCLPSWYKDQLKNKASIPSQSQSQQKSPNKSNYSRKVNQDRFNSIQFDQQNDKPSRAQSTVNESNPEQQLEKFLADLRNEEMKETWPRNFEYLTMRRKLTESLKTWKRMTSRPLKLT
jgi:hypothetical protein